MNKPLHDYWLNSLFHNYTVLASVLQHGSPTTWKSFYTAHEDNSTRQSYDAAPTTRYSFQLYLQVHQSLVNRFSWRKLKEARCAPVKFVWRVLKELKILGNIVLQGKYTSKQGIRYVS